MIDNEKQEIKSFDTRIWFKIIKLLAHEKKTVYKALFYVCIEAGISTLLPVLYSYTINTFLVGQGSTEDIIMFAIFYGCLVLFQAFVIFKFIDLCGKIETSVSYQTRKQAMDKLQNLPFSYYDVTPTGWIMARVTSDIGRLSEILSWSMIDMVWGIFMMIVLMITMLAINWKLSLIIIAVMPVVYFVSMIVEKLLITHYRKVRTINSRITSGFSEGIMGAKTTKTMGLEDIHYNEFSGITLEMKEKTMRSIIINSMYVPIILFLVSLSSSTLLWVGGDMVLKGALSIGTLVMFNQFANQFFEPLRNITGTLAQLQLAQASAERVISLLDKEPDLVDSPKVIDKYGTILDPIVESYEPIIGNIQFDNVDFYYLENEPVLENFNLTIKPQETIALVGETGSGKSTIVNLICRFYEPKKGQILIDDVDYKKRSIGWLHSKIGYVLQAPHLFSGSIADNVKYGKLDATMEEVERVCKMVDAHEFIISLEDGYNTDVGEGGNRLSTGQKQLISLARALISDPDIFVLDEATSSIDTETEAVIQNAIDNVLKDKTSIVIAHRLSTIKNVDRIIVMKNGKIIEEGNHDSLLKLKGYYHSLYIHQYEEEQQQIIDNISRQVSERSINI